MNTKIEWLLGLVLLQLLLVVLVLFSDSFQEEENPRFSSVDESLVAFFEIADQDSSVKIERGDTCLLYTSPSPRDATLSRMPSSA